MSCYCSSWYPGDSHSRTGLPGAVLNFTDFRSCAPLEGCYKCHGMLQLPTLPGVELLVEANNNWKCRWLDNGSVIWLHLC